MNFNTANDRASVFAKSEKSKRWNLIEQKFEKMASSRQTPLELQRYIALPRFKARMDALSSFSENRHTSCWPYGRGWTRMTDRLTRNGDPSLLRRNFFPFRHQPPLVAQKIDLFYPSG